LKILEMNMNKNLYKIAHFRLIYMLIFIAKFK
jgi:hypothetical protein